MAVSKEKQRPRPGQPVRGSKTGRPLMALLDLAGRRALLRVLWELRDGPLRFRPLQEACDGLSPTLLNKRLSELRETGLIELVDDGYALTALGHSLGEALLPLTRWADRWARALEKLPDTSSDA
jgi:DNA-binding HxlR family transcriptional regulator